MSDFQMLQPAFRVQLQEDGKVIGTLERKEGKLFFDGEVDASAKVLFDAVCSRFVTEEIADLQAQVAAAVSFLSFMDDHFEVRTSDDDVIAQRAMELLEAIASPPSTAPAQEEDG